MIYVLQKKDDSSFGWDRIENKWVAITQASKYQSHETEGKPIVSDGVYVAVAAEKNDNPSTKELLRQIINSCKELTKLLE